MRCVLRFTAKYTVHIESELISYHRHSDRFECIKLRDSRTVSGECLRAREAEKEGKKQDGDSDEGRGKVIMAHNGSGEALL